MKLRLYYTQKTKLEKLLKKEKNIAQAKRYHIVLSRYRGLSYSQINALYGSAPSTIARVLNGFAEEGIEGLRDRRMERPAQKVTDEYLEHLVELIGHRPRDYGWQRSSWTRELLVQQLYHETGIHCHESHLGRLLRRMNIRWGRPKAASKASQNPHGKAVTIGKLTALAAKLPADEVVLYQDEVDIHLNPKIGPCWMPRGEQYAVETPGRNKKRYLFGGLNPKTGTLIWTESERKNSDGFIAWLKELSQRYRRYRTIHIILDNYIIHKTKKVKAVLESMLRIKLHFLPPYSPEHNPIERLWGELHANITRNHTYTSIEKLMVAVHKFMEHATPYPGSRPSLAW